MQALFCHFYITVFPQASIIVVEAAVVTALENYMASLLFIMRKHLVPACLHICRVIAVRMSSDTRCLV